MPIERRGQGRNAAGRIRICFLLLAASLGSAGPARADFWYEHYDRADKALADGEWTDAVEELNQAIARKGDSSSRARTYGMRATPYFPYLKLGIAYYRLGQIDLALRAFETEEQLGAIAESQSALAELNRFRERAETARRAAAAEQAERVAQIVRQSLEEAATLAAGGRHEEAIEAVGRALAVAPESAAVRDAVERLQAEVVRQDEQRQRADRVARLCDQGRRFLAAEQYDEAARVFRQALNLRPDPAVGALLAAAQEKLRAELRRREDATERTRLVADGLRQARTLAAAGELAPALDRLEAVLALDPGNSEAQGLQERLLAAQARAEDAAARSETIAELLTAAAADFQGGRYEPALAGANRVLALDRENPAARALVPRAYAEISRRLLGPGRRRNLPPAIRFSDFRQELADGSRVERVRSPEFRLAGVVIDDSQVEVLFYDADGRQIPGTGSSQQVGDYYLTDFALRCRLRPGRTVLRLVATDAAGQSSQSEYGVDYDRPCYRSPWLYSGPATALLIVFALLARRRAAARRRLRRRRFNPYVAGAPVLDEDLFFGREQLIARILRTIHNNSLLLYGERRIGKTSLQHHLKRRLAALEDPTYDFHPVYVDLQGTPEERFFAALAEDVFEELAPVLDGLAPSPALGAGEYGYRDFVGDLRRVLKVLTSRNGKQVRLVLLIDEIDELNDYDPRINQRLRSLFMKSFAENLVAVVSGVEIRKQWEKEASPWYNFFEEIEVKPFRRADAEALIRRPIRGLFKLEPGVVDRIVALTDCRPYLIQKHCMALVNRLYDDRRRTITLADVEAVGRPEES